MNPIEHSRSKAHKMLIKVTWQEDRSVPCVGLHQGEAAIPQSKTAERLNTKSLTLT